MPLMYKAQTLQMSWCLDCHRRPERYLRPRDQVVNMNYQPPADQIALGRTLVKAYNIRASSTSRAARPVTGDWATHDTTGDWDWGLGTGAARVSGELVFPSPSPESPVRHRQN